MRLTEIFVQRPVLAIVVSLMILAAGLASWRSLPTQQFPKMENAAITVSTIYYGADPSLVASFITAPLENAISQTDGIDYVTSSSQSNLSIVSAKLRLNYDANRALTEISARVNSVLNQLPEGTQPPVITIGGGGGLSPMYIGFFSDHMSLNQITDYLARVVQPRLQAVSGVQGTELLGARNFALRVWVDPSKLAAYELRPEDITRALAANNAIAGLGITNSTTTQVILSAATGLHTVEQFENLVVKHRNDAVVRLKDVGTVKLGSDNYDGGFRHNGKETVFVGIEVAPTANLLDALKRVRSSLAEIQPRFPPSLKEEIDYDASLFVNSAIHEVKSALIESAVIVIVVILVFLGSLRSAIILTVTIPLSLIGTFTIMLLFGFSINLLTLLALVLAIGLVVDDAIIIVENVSRHVSSGMGLVEASIRSGRELGGSIVAITAVLVVVYLPIAFRGGLTGALFTEFALTLVGAITVSAVVALTLTPMMCSQLLNEPTQLLTSSAARTKAAIKSTFDGFQDLYVRLLRASLVYRHGTGVFVLLVLPGIYFLYGGSKHELAPVEDQGIILNAALVPPNMTSAQKDVYQREVYKRLANRTETDSVFQINMPGTALSGVILKSWDKRRSTSQELEPVIQADLSQIPGVRIASYHLPSLPGSEGLAVQFVLGTSQPFSELNEVSKRFIREASRSGLFAFLGDDLQIDVLQSTLVIDRDKIAALGLTASDVGNALSTLLGGGYVGYFELSGRPYKVIPQVQQRFRQNSQQVLDYYIRLGDNTSIPVSTVARMEEKVVPQSLPHFQQLNAATVGGALRPGVALGDALEYLKGLAIRTLPSGYTLDYAGASRQFIHESSQFGSMFGLAFVVIFLSLATLFESFRDPVIILVSVPMSMLGALAFVRFGVGGATLNIYTEVGMVTLMGLISKHGILIVQFANVLKTQGKSTLEAVVQAAAVRLRPILMTSAAMVFGVTPLLVATGAGAVSRFNIGLVIASGITVGTILTLFAVPAVYALLASEHRARTDLATDSSAGH